MSGRIVIASASAAIVETVEKSIRELCLRADIKRALDEVELNGLIERSDPDYIFLESNFCQIATAYIMANKLSAHRKLRFVIFSFDVLSPQDVGRFYSFGAAGFLDFRSLEDRRRGIAELLRGNEYFTMEAEKYLKDSQVGRLQNTYFTIREIQVLRYTARGKSLEEIAGFLSITLRSVQNVKTRVYQKAGVRNSVQMMLFALSMGYVTMDELMGNWNEEQGIVSREQLAVKRVQGGKRNYDD
jgi:DNA-binding NarL/FixJ family response regulator